ncbi:MAG: DUF4250 domain-containing protein [Clostridia bacterium]|nr:DUF4250 domain-containing protein [Clostridia bacterium]MDE7084512.1 DUF4250 domain-containing protein [Clostridia bacterium]MDE7256645.1 DUF4250 domain-containing protein [Clostridia bacterium]
MGLPTDDNILLSLVNTRLRDGDDLGGFCAAYGAEESELVSRLAASGYVYDEESNSFKRI